MTFLNWYSIKVYNTSTLYATEKPFVILLLWRKRKQDVANLKLKLENAWLTKDFTRTQRDSRIEHGSGAGCKRGERGRQRHEAKGKVRKANRQAKMKLVSATQPIHAYLYISANHPNLWY